MSCPILPCARTLLALSMSLNVVQRTRGTASHKRVSVHVLVIAKNSNLFIAILEGLGVINEFSVLCSRLSYIRKRRIAS
jgi:hypothetical protein